MFVKHDIDYPHSVCLVSVKIFTNHLNDLHDYFQTKVLYRRWWCLKYEQIYFTENKIYLFKVVGTSDDTSNLALLQVNDMTFFHSKCVRFILEINYKYMCNFNGEF